MPPPPQRGRSAIRSRSRRPDRKSSTRPRSAASSSTCATSRRCAPPCTRSTRLGSTMTATLVQQMVPGGVELLVGGVVDPTFGPLVGCGSGGVLVDLLADTAFRLHPLTDLAAAEMVDGLKGVRLLRGYRGIHPPTNMPSSKPCCA